MASNSSASDKDEKTKLTLAAASLGYIEIQDERGRFWPLWLKGHPSQQVVEARVWRQKSRGHFVSTYTAAEIYPLQAPETQPTRK